MKLIDYAIVGSGLCSFIATLKEKNSTVLTKLDYNSASVFRVLNFYEFNNPGGNTNIWGAYVNLFRFKRYLNLNKDFKKFYASNKYFSISKISNNKNFKNVGYIQNIKSKKIFRLNSTFFKNKINFDLKKIIIRKNFIYLYSKKKSYRVKKLNLCIGNYGLLKVLKDSGIVKDHDIISYEDSLIKYSLNIFPDFKKYYIIPMSIRQIIEKLVYKSHIYRENENNFNIFIQAISNKKKIFKMRTCDLFSSNKSFHRGMTTNHIANLKINNESLDKFIKKHTKRIIINCSGTIPKYIPGSISQDLIYNTFKNS